MQGSHVDLFGVVHALLVLSWGDGSSHLLILWFLPGEKLTLGFDAASTDSYLETIDFLLELNLLSVLGIVIDTYDGHGGILAVSSCLLRP